jgi:hypothetical protein
VFGDDAIILKDHTSITSFFIKKMEVLLKKKGMLLLLNIQTSKLLRHAIVTASKEDVIVSVATSSWI